MALRASAKFKLRRYPFMGSVVAPDNDTQAAIKVFIKAEKITDKLLKAKLTAVATKRSA